MKKEKGLHIRESAGARKENGNSRAENGRTPKKQ